MEKRGLEKIADCRRWSAAHVEVLTLPTAGRAAEPQGQWVALGGDQLGTVRQWFQDIVHRSLFFFDFTLYTLYGIFMGMWQIEMEPIKDWLDGLDKQTAYQVYAALDLLRERGPNLKRPLVGKIEGSIIGSMKELRPGSVGRSEVRILFVFDPERKAVMLVGGDKQNKWNKWYKTAIREAERRYIRWLEEQHGKDTK